MRFARSFALATLALALAGCQARADGAPTTPPAEGSPTEGLVEADESGVTEAGVVVARELPGELVAELRQRGDDENGRLLTLAPGFVATAACSDCGAPSYLRFLAVRCVDTHHCEVLTEQCEGNISRSDDTYELEFHVVEGAGDDDAACAGYTGTFEPTP